MSQRSTILYVDDEEFSHMLFKAVFVDDYEIHTALSGREAIDVLRREEVHVLVTDQCMPEMTGVELLEAIRDEFPDLGRVMLTAYSDIDSVIQAINAGGIDRYVTKPWEADDLRVVIDRAAEVYARRARRRRHVEELERQATREKRLRQELQKHVPQPVLDEILRDFEGD